VKRLVAGLVAGLAAGLVGWLAFGFVGWLAFGFVGWLAFGLVGGLAVGANAWTRYRVSVVILAVRQQAPLRFDTFLDWAQQAGLLRVSGVTYQFRHRQLQDWLTSPDDPHATGRQQGAGVQRASSSTDATSA
jgi:hypothetical protein